MKIAESIKLAYPSAEQAEWVNMASNLAQAIIERALAMPTEELRVFIAETTTGKHLATGCDDTLASASVMARNALL